MTYGRFKNWDSFLTRFAPSTRLRSRKGFFGHPRIGLELSPLEGPRYCGPSAFIGISNLGFWGLETFFPAGTSAPDKGQVLETGLL